MSKCLLRQTGHFGREAWGCRYLERNKSAAEVSEVVVVDLGIGYRKNVFAVCPLKDCVMK